MPVPGGKTSELLVRLALEAGVFVPADRLVADIWAGAVTNRNTRQAKVARLRRGLADPSAIVTGEGAYKLAVEPAEVDALCVLRDTAAAAQRLDAGDHRGAAELSAAALERYRGEVLPSTGDWAAPHRARLEEARLKLVETRLSARLQLGHDVVGDLEAAVTADAYQEGLWELLITALYRAGRQADALATYQRFRARLADELGLDPGPRLRQLEQRVLNHDPGLRAVSGNLPSMSAELVGREPEVAALAGLLRDARLGEVLGPGGMGKAAGATAAGRRLTDTPGGVWLARLEAATTADEVLDTVIAALDVTGGEAALVERVKSAPAVVILDNCEHVVDAAAALAVRLLDAAPGLRILCTTQVPLDVEGEVPFELAPLPPPRPPPPVGPPAPPPPARARRRRRAVRPPGHLPPGRGRRCGGGAVPLTRRAAARDRAGRRADPDAVDRRDRPPPRRSLQRPARPHEPPPGATAGAQGDDRVELRAALPRRQARPVGARDLRRRRAARRGRVRPRGARRAGVSGDRRGRAARRPLAGDRRRRRAAALPPARQHPRVRARRDGGGGPAGARARRPRRMVRRCRRRVDPGRAQRSAGRAPGLRARRARQRRRSAGVERHARRAARAQSRQRLRLGVDRARRQPRLAARPGRPRRRRRGRLGRRPRPRAAARSLDRGVDGASRPRPPARHRGRRAGRRDRRRRAAGARRLLPRVRGVPSRRVRSGDGADRPQR